MTDYWHSLKDEFGHGELRVDGMNSTLLGHELAPRAAREWFRQKGYRWADLKRGSLRMGMGDQMWLHMGTTTLAALGPTFVRWTYTDANSDSPIPIYPESLWSSTRPWIPVIHDECSFDEKDMIGLMTVYHSLAKAGGH